MTELPEPDWTNEFEAWCAEQDDAEDINRMLREAENEAQ